MARDIPELVVEREPRDVAPLGHGLSLRAYLAIAGATPALIALTILGVFLPVVLLPFAFSDDYPLLWMAVSHTPSTLFGETVFHAYALGGRPVAGAFYAWSFSAAGTIEHLRFIRLFAVVTIVALALLMHWALIRAGFGRALAALLAVFVCSMPAFQLYVSWVALTAAPFAALVAGGASVLSEAATDASRRRFAFRLTGAIAMLLVGLLIYQPTAMLFWVFLAIALVGARQEPRSALRTALTHLGVGGVALALAFLITRLIPVFLTDTAHGSLRNALATDVVGKARYFVEEPLYRSLNLFELRLSPWVAAVVAAVAVGGVLLWLLRQSSQPVLYLAIGAALVPLSFLPNLVVTENSPAIRTLGALSSLVALYFGLGAVGVWLTVRDWIRPQLRSGALRATDRAALAIAMAFVGGSVLVAADNVTNLMAVPQATELRIVRSQVAALPAGAKHIDFFATPGVASMSKLVVGEEFGMATTSKYYALGPLLLLLLREGGQLPPGTPEPLVETHEPTVDAHPPGLPVIDARVLQLLR